jgi:hypothetical protein
VDSYSALLEAVQSFAVRPDTKFSNQFPNFMTLAEARIYNGGSSFEPSSALRATAMDVTTTIAMVSGSGTIANVNDVLDIQKIYRATDTMRAGMEYMKPQAFEGFAARYTSGNPKAYTIEGSTLRVAPAYTGDLSLGYWKRFPAVTVGAPTNDVLSAHPEVWFHALMFEAYKWMQDAQKAAGYLSQLQASIDGANRKAQAMRMPGNLRMRPGRAVI